MKMIHFMPDSRYSNGQMGEFLNSSLHQLTDILKKFGLEEMTIREDYLQYRLKTELFNDPLVIQDFCQCIEEMHKEIVHK